MISEREKIAWVFGYMKSNYDLFLETGVSSYEAEKLSDSLNKLSSKYKYSALSPKSEAIGTTNLLK